MIHSSEEWVQLDPAQESPHHGFRGASSGETRGERIPRSLTIAISRETGSRGATIAKRVGQALGWQVYTQDLLEYSAQDETVLHEIIESLPPDSAAWVEHQLRASPLWQNADRFASTLPLARLILALAAQGEVILIGRGAGFLLPRGSTLHVRFIAPLPDRVAYMSQWLRLTEEEAAAQVEARDRQRQEFIETQLQRSPSDVYLYDMTLNSSFLGEELAAELIRTAALAKLKSQFPG